MAQHWESATVVLKSGDGYTYQFDFTEELEATYKLHAEVMQLEPKPDDTHIVHQHTGRKFGMLMISGECKGTRQITGL